ncbi:MAG: pyridoxal phosphate-dependent aminotransferase [Acidobacteria bacterium]|nr:pyridoxal phosphate-dependent aminotransferase [Acidobacteriota bacterium]
MKEFQPASRLRDVQKSAIRQFFDRAPSGSVNMGLGEPDLPTAAIIREAARRAIEEGKNGYTPHAGLPELRECVAAQYPQFKSPDSEVIITAGSQEALYLALMTIVDEGDEVLLPDPGFIAYRTITRMAGGRPVFYRLPNSSGFAFDLDEFRRHVTHRTKLVVCTSPSNPTGRALAQEDLIAMAEALRDTGAYAISDEIYRELFYTPDRPASISEFFPQTIILGGLSKSMSMTGWRLGWMCGDAAVVRSALVLHGYVTTCASAISQKAALPAWTDEGERARDTMRRIFRERRDYLLSALPREAGLSAVAPEGAFYTMVDVRAHGSSEQVAEAMLRHRVITVPGSAFGEEGRGFLRVSFCGEIPVLSEGVQRMKAALDGLGK